MKIACLDHVNVRTTDVESMAAWYEAVLSLARGPRPDFPFPGAWLYLNGRAIVHLIGTTSAPGADFADLRLEHFALEAEGLPAFLDRLAATSTPYRLGVTPGEPPIGGIVQVNIADPDGNHIHVDFREPLPLGVTLPARD